MSEHDGGPAYPLNPDTNLDCKGNIYPEAMGKTLRDWFAGQAMSTFMQSFVAKDGDIPPPSQCARWCYQYADAMLAERKRNKRP